MMMGMDKIALVENLTIRIEKELREQLDAIAARDDRSVSYVVRQLLIEAITARGEQHA